MKFKYTGEDNCFSIELVAYNIMSRDEYLKKGMVVDVPNDLTGVINSLKASGVFHEVKDFKKVSKKEDK
jgi:hypothetical protein